MTQFAIEYYLWIKAFHIIFVIAWMAGMLYLPRLFVYHHQVEIGSDEDKRFQIMELKLIRMIINPAMIIAMILGIMLCFVIDLGTWFHLKATLLLLMFAVHGLLSRWRKKFAKGEYPYSENFFRIFNEVPAILMIGIVIMAIVKPL